MHALDSPEPNPEPNLEPSPEQMQLRRERRVLAAVLTMLLVTTAAVSPLAFGNLPLFLLSVAPFAIVLISTVLIAPLSVSQASARAARHRTAALHTARMAAASRHAIVTPRRNTLLPDDPAALAAAVTAAAVHGIHFGCAHLRDDDFLQAFHATEIRAADFRHGDHLRYTVLMLQRVPAGLVEETIAKNLRAFLRQVCGSEALFHATRTHAWVTVLHAHLRASPRASFAHLLQQHAADLHGDVLSRFYSSDLLRSDEARRRTVKPDLDPLPIP
ncbi:hypothetical protein [Terriglobus sp.]|uniref:hypothetical protein n=1 Tax=Terriglobus sp. TaxID=1889013 RepID=UPI003B001212